MDKEKPDEDRVVNNGSEEHYTDEKWEGFESEALDYFGDHWIDQRKNLEQAVVNHPRLGETWDFPLSIMNSDYSHRNVQIQEKEFIKQLNQRKDCSHKLQEVSCSCGYVESITKCKKCDLLFCHKCCSSAEIDTAGAVNQDSQKQNQPKAKETGNCKMTNGLPIQQAPGGFRCPNQQHFPGLRPGVQQNVPGGMRTQFQQNVPGAIRPQFQQNNPGMRNPGQQNVPRGFPGPNQQKVPGALPNPNPQNVPGGFPVPNLQNVRGGLPTPQNFPVGFPPVFYSKYRPPLDMVGLPGIFPGLESPVRIPRDPQAYMEALRQIANIKNQLPLGNAEFSQLPPNTNTSQKELPSPKNNLLTIAQNTAPTNQKSWPLNPASNSAVKHDNTNLGIQRPPGSNKMPLQDGLLGPAPITVNISNVNNGMEKSSRGKSLNNSPVMGKTRNYQQNPTVDFQKEVPHMSMTEKMAKHKNRKGPSPPHSGNNQRSLGRRNSNSPILGRASVVTETDEDNWNDIFRRKILEGNQMTMEGIAVNLRMSTSTEPEQSEQDLISFDENNPKPGKQQVIFEKDVPEKPITVTTPFSPIKEIKIEKITHLEENTNRSSAQDAASNNNEQLTQDLLSFLHIDPDDSEKDKNDNKDEFKSHAISEVTESLNSELLQDVEYTVKTEETAITSNVENAPQDFPQKNPFTNRIPNINSAANIISPIPLKFGIGNRKNLSRLQNSAPEREKFPKLTDLKSGPSPSELMKRKQSVYVTHFYSFNKVHIVSTDAFHHDLPLLNEDIFDITTEETGKLFSYPPEVGTVLVAPLNGVYLRAVVEEVCFGRFLVVRFIDVGSKIRLRLGSVFQATKEVLEVPILGTEVYLNDINDLKTDMILMSEFTDFVGKWPKKERKCLLQSVDNINGDFYVNLLFHLNGVTKSISKEIVRLGRWEWQEKWEKTQGVTESTLCSESQWKINCFERQLRRLPVGEKTKGTVAASTAENAEIALLLNIEGEYYYRSRQVLQKQIELYVKSVKADANFFPALGEYILAYVYPNDHEDLKHMRGIGKWSRCVREGAIFINLDECEVYPMSVEYRHIIEIRKYCPDFAKVPFFMTNCRIKDCIPLDDKKEQIFQELSQVGNILTFQTVDSVGYDVICDEYHERFSD